MVKMKRMVSSSGRSGTLMDASLALDDVELLPEEAAFLKMIHSTNLEQQTSYKIYFYFFI